MNRQAWRDFFITVFFLGIAFVIALLSSVAAEQNNGRLAAVAAAVSLVLALLGALYIIPRLARNVRLEILRFAIRTTVTVEGLLFIVFLVVMGFAAWNTGNNLLYLVLSAMLAFLVAANLIARISLAEMSVQLRFPDHITATEPASLTVTLVNHKRWMPSYSLMVEALSEASGAGRDVKPRQNEEARGREPVTDDSPAGQRPAQHAQAGIGLGKLAYFVLTAARTSVRQRIEHTFSQRGRYSIVGFRLSTKFPAGFFKKWRSIDATGEIIVYPKPQPLDDFYHALPMLAGQIQSHARGSGDDLYAIRRYHPSDDMRHIDWKATAKSAGMMVRENTREDEWRLTIVFDTTQPEKWPAAQPSAAQNLDGKAEAGNEFKERFEGAVVMAASLASHFIFEQSEVELITLDEEHNVPTGSGQEHLYKILRSLATIQPVAAAQVDEAGKEPVQKRKQGLFRRSRHSNDEKQDPKAVSETKKPAAATTWRQLGQVPILADERRFKVLITSAAKGTIPANVWRSAHVVFLDDL